MGNLFLSYPRENRTNQTGMRLNFGPVSCFCFGFCFWVFIFGRSSFLSFWSDRVGYYSFLSVHVTVRLFVEILGWYLVCMYIFPSPIKNFRQNHGTCTCTLSNKRLIRNETIRYWKKNVRWNKCYMILIIGSSSLFIQLNIDNWSVFTNSHFALTAVMKMH